MRYRGRQVSSLFVSLVFASAKATSSDENHAKDLIDWLKSKGGVFNPKLEIRRADPNNQFSPFGMFANDMIEDKELLLSIPRKCLISSGELMVGDRVHAKSSKKGIWDHGQITAVNPDGTYAIAFDDGIKESSAEPMNVELEVEDSVECETIRNLIRELKLGDKSEYAPYVNYLLDQPAGQLPSAWSANGKNLLLEVLGFSPEHGLTLPPQYPIGLSWKEDCMGTTNDALENNAYMLFLQRGWDDLLIPVYDMMSHRNGQWLNTESNPVHTAEDIQVRASRPIEAGEEIYTTYNFCEDCGARLTNYGTPEILRDYGFVEQLPQRWIFHEQKVAFDLDEVPKGSGELKVSWLQKPSLDGVQFLEAELQRLKELKEAVMDAPKKIMPPQESATIWQFHNALTVAMAHAIKAAAFEDECPDGICKVTSGRYDDLKAEEGPWDYNTRVCDDVKMFSLPGHDFVETVNTPYQEINFYKDPRDQDVCFELDSIVQICGSYRPHYHEMVVHYTARFLENIKRVVWVGGGDSMLLHEIIKYPNLEFVLGLELDQQVTRNSFKYFGTQPHWDNEKVQWWYGDATKSLMMLPKEYFGTFDMVLVDLSETVMSMSVTDELDVMEAFALLLKPEGIFVKNELYLEKLSDMFDHTIMIHYYDVPVICSQALILGSNSVDFLEREPRDHHIENLYVTPLDKSKDKYEIFHDYRKRNHTGVHKYCMEPGEKDPEPVEQKKSPGILMLVEAEDATATLNPSKKVEGILVKALKKEGLTVVSSVTPSSDDKKSVAVVILKEGYVVARTWPEHKYCAFDIHLWSSFEKHDGVRKALIQAVGSNRGPSSSAYRIVAGGMFGVSSWKEDEKNRGPKKTQICDLEAGESSPGVPMDSGIVDTVLEESVSLIQDSDVTVAVLCGDQSEACKSLDVLKKHKNVKEAIGLFTCSTVEDGQGYKEDGLEHMVACEEDVQKLLNGSVTDEAKIRAIVVDSSATYEMAQILLKILTSRTNRKRMLTPSIMVMTATLNELEEWRDSFLQRFHRRIIKSEPVFRAGVVFNSTDSSMTLDVTSSGDRLFVQHLVDMKANLEEQTGLSIEVHDLHGAVFDFLPNFVPSQYFLPGDYNQSSPYEQYKSQQPLGRQTIFQLETQSWADNVIVGDFVQGNYEEEGRWYGARVLSANPDGTFNLGYDDGDKENGVHLHNIRKMAPPEGHVEKVTMSESQVKEALKQAAALMKSEDMSKMELKEFTKVGDGSVIVGTWSGGTVIVMWDGRIHVDVNLFTYTEDKEVADAFVKFFQEQIPNLNIALRDDQPRGTGRVVNFSKDIERNVDPHWAIFK